MSRTLASAKKAGATFEREVADYLKTVLGDARIDRRVKTGANDKGDIAALHMSTGGRVVMECKNVKRDALPAWIREAEVERVNDGAFIGVVCHKRHRVADPGLSYVSMTLDTFATLLRGEPLGDSYSDGDIS